MTNKIPKELIEASLALCKYMYDDMNVDIWFCDEGGCDFRTEFSIEKFFYYLLSPEFIKKYSEPLDWEDWVYANRFWRAIYEYQSWNPEPLIEFLKKI